MRYPKFTSVDEFVANYPPEMQAILTKIRQIILTAAPEAVESISYGMPAYKLNKKPLVYFSAYPKHIGLYATPAGHQHFQAELAQYKQGKGSVQFPIDQPIPYDLIKQIVNFKVSEIITK
jgi:uncharacterized protein YdhG (YjbR/CyaY superfamily)